MVGYSYDKENKRRDYTYMAREKKSRNIVCGYVAIHKPWYEPESNWKYYMFYDSYRPGGFCGGAINEGLKKVEVDPKTIVPYTQVAEIISVLQSGDTVHIEGKDLPEMMTTVMITSVDDMYRYYNREDIDYVVERFGEPAKEKEFINVRKTGHFQDFVDGIIEKQKTQKRSELLAAITDFWNAWKSIYSEVIIGTGGEYDYEYIEEENGKFTSSLLDGEYDSFDEIVKDFCKVVDPDDVVIICGDFGMVWEESGESASERYWLKWLEDKPFTTVFVCGNHENFDRLYQYPVKEWHGGKVHEIRPHVLHLMRGEVFDIEGLKFFAFGGASSHDIRDGIIDPAEDENWRETAREWYKAGKMYRIKGISWWEQELPTQGEMDNGIKNLERVGNKVDYIITHSPSASVIALLGYGLYEQDVLTRYLEDIRSKVEYKKHFCGHMHVDKAVNEKDIILYEQIIRLA